MLYCTTKYRREPHEGDEDQKMSNYGSTNFQAHSLPVQTAGWETKDQSLRPEEVLGKLHSFPMTDQVYLNCNRTTISQPLTVRFGRRNRPGRRTFPWLDEAMQM